MIRLALAVVVVAVLVERWRSRRGRHAYCRALDLAREAR